MIAPIAGRLGLKGPIERAASTMEIRVAFVGVELGFEFSVDLRDFFAFITIFRPINGAVPPVLELPGEGRHHVQLQLALEESGLIDRRARDSIRALGGNPTTVTRAVEELGELLERHWNALLLTSEKLWQKRVR